MRSKIPEAERLMQITQIERPFWENSNCMLAGMDEVGRGPLAGPVVVACVVLPSEPLIEYVNDSKKLSEKRRELLYPKICESAITHSTAWIYQDMIDEHNILQATKMAFQEAFISANNKQKITDVLIDALEGLTIDANQHVFVHGDARSYLIAAASIIAKVERDHYMVEMDAIYPEYGFARNKGYGTAEHIAALKKFGPCPIHRKSFIKKLIG